MLAFLEAHVDAGGVIDADSVAAKFGWKIESARDAIANLAAAGHLVKVGVEPRTRRQLWTLRGPGESRSKACGGCGATKAEAEFFYSRSSPDLLTSLCRACIAQNSERDRRERNARDRQSRQRRAEAGGVTVARLRGAGVREPRP